MSYEEMKIGPKGQVVIPSLYRKRLNLSAGSRVIVELLDEAVTIKPLVRDIVADYARLSKKADAGKRVRVHDGYDEELNERTRKILSRIKRRKTK